ncbi:hypothetical protein E4U53_000980 [Claviceps sorghi]|nr:hypothetical protein E4U53_000980 [Claviceps sorghi]
MSRWLSTMVKRLDKGFENIKLTATAQDHGRKDQSEQQHEMPPLTLFTFPNPQGSKLASKLIHAFQPPMTPSATGNRASAHCWLSSPRGGRSAAGWGRRRTGASAPWLWDLGGRAGQPQCQRRVAAASREACSSRDCCGG